MYEVSYSLIMIYNFKENFTPTNYIHITKGYCNFYVFKIDHKPEQVVNLAEFAIVNFDLYLILKYLVE